MRKYVCVDDIGNDHQPADRRGPGPRRPRAGHRAGAVGGGGVRRRRAPWCPARSSTTCCRRRPTRSASTSTHTDDPVDHQHARHQGRRRGRHHRLHAGGRQRGRRRRPPPRRRRHPDAVHARAGVEGDPRARAGRRTPHPPPMPRPHFDEGAPNQDPAAGPHGRSRPVIPAPVRLRRPDEPSTRRWRRSAEHGDDAKVLAGGQSLLPVLRMRLNAPEMVIDLGRHRGPAGHPGRRRRHRHRRDDPVPRRASTTPLVAGARRGCSPRRSRRWPTRRSGTAARSAAPWSHADPAGDLGAPALALDASWSIAGPGGERTVAAGGLLRRPLRDRGRRGRAAHRGPHPQAHRVGRALREVRPGRAPVADRGGRGDGPGRGRHHRRGAGRPDQHGLDAAAGHAPSRRPSSASRPTEDARTRRGGDGGRRHQPAVATSTATPTTAGTSPRVLTRRAVLAAAGADRDGAEPHVHRPDRRRGDLGALQGHRTRSPSCFPGARSPRPTASPSAGTVQGQARPDRAASTTAPAPSSRRTRPPTGSVVDAKGKDKRGQRHGGRHTSRSGMTEAAGTAPT